MWWSRLNQSNSWPGLSRRPIMATSTLRPEGKREPRHQPCHNGEFFTNIHELGSGDPVMNELAGDATWRIGLVAGSDDFLNIIRVQTH